MKAALAWVMTIVWAEGAMPGMDTLMRLWRLWKGVTVWSLVCVCMRRP